MERQDFLATGTAAPTESMQDWGTHSLLGLEQRFGKSKSIFLEQHPEQPAEDRIPAVTQEEWLDVVMVCYIHPGIRSQFQLAT